MSMVVCLWKINGETEALFYIFFLVEEGLKVMPLV